MLQQVDDDSHVMAFSLNVGFTAVVTLDDFGYVSDKDGYDFANSLFANFSIELVDALSTAEDSGFLSMFRRLSSEAGLDASNFEVDFEDSLIYFVDLIDTVVVNLVTCYGGIIDSPTSVPTTTLLTTPSPQRFFNKVARPPCVFRGCLRQFSP